MNEAELVIFIQAVLMCIIFFFVGYFLQDYSKKGLFFGVSIPESCLVIPEFIGLKRKYKRNFLISNLIYTFLFLTSLYLTGKLWILYVGILLFVVVLELNYYIIYRKVKEIKKAKRLEKPQKNIVIVDMRFRENKSKKILLSPSWFLLPLVLVLFNIIIAFAYYNKLPMRIPVHWDLNGNVNRWVNKSHLSVLQMPLVELFMTALMFGIYKIIGRVKQQISPENAEVSKEQNRLFRYFWSIFILVMAVLTNLIYTYIQLIILGIIKMNNTIIFVITGVIMAYSLISVIISIKIGQGGSRLKVNVKNDENIYSNRNDDKYWKLGSYYYNPDDPSLFVEKRVGIGWDFNYARPAAKIIMAFIILTIIASVVMVVKLS